MKSGTALLEGTGGGEGPLADLTTVNPNGIPLSTLTLDDIATAMARRGQSSHQRRDGPYLRTVPPRLSLLSHPPNHYRDLSWISPRLDPARVFVWSLGPCPLNASHRLRRCFNCLHFLFIFGNSGTEGRGGGGLESHHADRNSAKSKQPCQKNVKSLPFPQRGY